MMSHKTNSYIVYVIMNDNFFIVGVKKLREKILKTAKELFIKNGYNATTTGDIVKYAGK